MHAIATTRKAGIMAGRKRNLKAKISDDGYEYHEGFLIRRIETTAGIRFQVDLGKLSGKYVRRSFKTKSEARGCAASRRLELDRHGLAHNLGPHVGEQIGKLQADIIDYAGREFNLNSPQQLGEVLFTEMGLPPTRRRDDQASRVISS